MLSFIVTYQRNHGGVSPSYPDMMAGCGMASKASVARAMGQLIDFGKIRTLPNRARAIEVLSGAGAASEVRERLHVGASQPVHIPTVPLVHPGPEAQFFVVQKVMGKDGEEAKLVPMEGAR